MKVAKVNVAALTSIRGLAAMWVVLYHFWSDVLLLLPAADFLTPLMRVGLYAVPLFFILSGYVISANYFDYLQPLSAARYTNFIKKRLLRIYPVHLAALLVVLALWLLARALGKHYDPAGYSLKTFVENLFLVQSWDPHFVLAWNFPAWSISSEFFAYLCFPWLVAPLTLWVNTRNRKRLMIVAAAAGSAAIYSMYEGHFFEVLVVIPTFLAGIAIYRYLEDQRSVASHKTGLSYALLLAILLVPYLFPGLWATRALILLFVVLIYVLASHNATANLWSRPVPMYLGEVSYSLYMTHTIAQKLLHGVMPAERFSGQSLLVRLAVLMAYLAAVAATTLVCYYAVEKRFHRPPRFGDTSLAAARA